MTGCILILGATGRAGNAIAQALSTSKQQIILVGRSQDALDRTALRMPNVKKTVLASNIAGFIQAIQADRPAVVINTVGPFGGTAMQIIYGCPPGTHYIDLANEMQVLEVMIAAETHIKSRQQCVVTGAGWGVLATESVVLKMCSGQPNASRVRVDNLASVKADGTLGETVAATIVDNLKYGGRCYRDGHLQRVRMGYRPERFLVPDGTTAITGGVSTADMEAARRASGASDVVAGAEQAPTSFLLSTMVSLIGALSRLAFVRIRLHVMFAKMPNQPPKRETSWARAVVEWPSGKRQVGWLKAGDAYDFLASAVAQTAIRLADQRGRPGVFTPGALFGAELAEIAGASFLLTDQTDAQDTK